MASNEEQPDDGAPEPARDPERADRREFLRHTALAAAGLAVGCGDDAGPPTGDAGPGGADGGPAITDAGTDAPSATDAGPPVSPPPEDTLESMAFGLGVASGDVTATDAIVWTRYDGSAPLRVTVWRMSGEDYALTVYDELVTPAPGGFVHVDVPLPEPGARYRYVFFEVDGDSRLARSPVGRFRAAVPDDDRGLVRLGAVSCTHNGRTFATLGHAGARDDLDAFLFLGDTTYADGSRNLDDYRAKWAENLATEQYRALRASVSALATFDDHEVDNDFDPETIDGDQLAAALAAFHEHQPIRLDATAPGRRIWKSIRWGRTVEVFVLDCRSERRPSTRSSSAPIYISRDQMQWLTMGLINSEAVFKVIMNSVPISDFPGAFDFAQADRWEGYAAQRTEILRFIDDNAISGVLWVAGDFHLASAGRVSTSGPGASQIEVLVGPGAQNGNILAATLVPPQFDWASSRDNYAVIELDPTTSQVAVFYHDQDDSVLEVVRYTL